MVNAVVTPGVNDCALAGGNGPVDTNEPDVRYNVAVVPFCGAKLKLWLEISLGGVVCLVGAVVDIF
jgi:hypothetical protein